MNAAGTHDRLRRAIAALISGALVLASGAAAADEGTPSVQVLAHADLPEMEQSWISAHLDRVRLHKKSGFAYTTRVARADGDLELSVHGPAMGSVKRLGVAFEVRF